MKDVFYVNAIYLRRPLNPVQNGYANCITHFKIHRLCDFAAFSVPDSRYLVLEYMGGGDFLMLLLQKAPLREDETCFYLAEMINGVDACHKLGFMHRDIKVRSILL